MCSPNYRKINLEPPFILIKINTKFQSKREDGLNHLLSIGSSIFKDVNISGIVFVTESSDFSRHVVFLKKGVSVKLKGNYQVYEV
jgi:hypothetical protein